MTAFLVPPMRGWQCCLLSGAAIEALLQIRAVIAGCSTRRSCSSVCRALMLRLAALLAAGCGVLDSSRPRVGFSCTVAACAVGVGAA